MTPFNALELIAAAAESRRKVVRLYDEVMGLYRAEIADIRATSTSAVQCNTRLEIATARVVRILAPVVTAPRPCECDREQPVQVGHPDRQPTSIQSQPGPWRLGRQIFACDETGGGLYQPVDDLGRDVAGVWVFMGPHARPETVSNVNLILAASVVADSLDACREALDSGLAGADNGHVDLSWDQATVLSDKANAALALAENARWEISTGEGGAP